MLRLLLSLLLLLGCWRPRHAPPVLATWNRAVATAQQALARRPLPPDVRHALAEEGPYAAAEAEQRRTFLLYLQRQHRLPFPAGAVVVELPTAGEKTALQFFLLTRAGAQYRVTAYDGTQAWRTGKRTVLPASFGDSLLSNRRCFYQGHNQEAVTVTRFRAEGRQATAQFFPPRHLLRGIGHALPVIVTANTAQTLVLLYCARCMRSRNLSPRGSLLNSLIEPVY